MGDKAPPLPVSPVRTDFRQQRSVSPLETNPVAEYFSFSVRAPHRSLPNKTHCVITTPTGRSLLTGNGSRPASVQLLTALHFKHTERSERLKLQGRKRKLHLSKLRDQDSSVIFTNVLHIFLDFVCLSSCFSERGESRDADSGFKYEADITETEQRKMSWLVI